MNYSHAYHAGNFADAMKHTALVAALSHLRRKETPFAMIDTHAGRGLYDLGGMEAGKTGEAAEGIGRLLGATAGGAAASLPEALTAYADVVLGFGPGKYPGSPLIAAAMLRRQDRLIAIERHEEEFGALKTALSPYARARAISGDGYDELRRLIPPPEKRGLVLIDPPYEDDDEFERVAETFDRAYARFATGIYMIWLPMKVRHDADALAGELLNAGAAKLLLLTLDVGRAADAEAERLSACGVFVANPPFGFADAMQSALSAMGERLRQGEGAGSAVEWLAGSE
jgi:23S rRNA (adenine2030-N6)-methyltransferase